MGQDERSYAQTSSLTNACNPLRTTFLGRRSRRHDRPEVRSRADRADRKTGFDDLGYVEGRHFQLEPRSAEGRFDRLPRPIVLRGGTPA